MPALIVLSPAWTPSSVTGCPKTAGVLTSKKSAATSKVFEKDEKDILPSNYFFHKKLSIALCCLKRNSGTFNIPIKQEW